MTAGVRFAPRLWAGRVGACLEAGLAFCESHGTVRAHGDRHRRLTFSSGVSRRAVGPLREACSSSWAMRRTSCITFSKFSLKAPEGRHAGTQARRHAGTQYVRRQADQQGGRRGCKTNRGDVGRGEGGTRAFQLRTRSDGHQSPRFAQPTPMIWLGCPRNGQPRVDAAGS